MGTYAYFLFCKKDDITGELTHVGERELELEFAKSQDYAFYGFLGCECRNYAGVPELKDIRELSKIEIISLGKENHYCTHYLVPVKTLVEFDWDSTFENRRCSVQVSDNYIDGSGTCDIGQGEMVVYKEEFAWFYERLHYLTDCGATHLVYYFD